MKNTFLLVALFISFASFSQSYEDSVRIYLKNYVQKHEVVKGHNKEHMQFFEVTKAFPVVESVNGRNK